GPDVPPPPPPETKTEITVRKAPEPTPGTVVEGGPVTEGARGGEPGTAAKVELPAETAPDAAETAAPEGKGAGDSTVLPAIEVEEGANVPGFYGSDQNIASRKLAPGELNANWDKYIYEATDRPTMARDESIGPEQFKDFRQSEN